MIQKDLVVDAGNPRDPDLEAAIDEAAEFEGRRMEMQKDRHLIVAALRTERRIISLNEKDRERFARICDQVTQIQRIVWVNPCLTNENCSEWLKRGANSDEHRRLAHYTKSE